MIRNRLYYRVKPLLPASLRLGIRRWFALRKRARVTDCWPIAPRSEQAPPGWPGWPGGKQFALVLTHDVEGSAGLDRHLKLMELEKRLGFRSSFNLIPEGGEYQVSEEIRQRITREGFEVGVHDLYHDGRLFLTEREFRNNAGKINRYLGEWGAGGFRSGFMLHNLDWIHQLELRYDASTFDTDPFEPQPQGRHTIFPFWVSRTGMPATSGAVPGVAGGKPSTGDRGDLGYAELPYTLPQDSTLFLLLSEQQPEIWIRKLDWIARHGGMALMNVHPDYMHFEGEPDAPRTYPAEFYSRFLQYARDQYSGAFWQPLPGELAAFVAQHRIRCVPKRKRVCMVAYSDYMADARVTRYAEALAQRGDHVDVIALKRSPGAPFQETLGNINLVRLRPRFGKNERTAAAFVLPVLRFLLASSWWIARQHRRQRYDLLHIHNIPDFLVFAAWFPRLTGAKTILDIHDIVPEFYSSKFSARNKSLGVALLKWVERASAWFADHVIIANHLWLDKYASRTGAQRKCSVFINNVDDQIFRLRPRSRQDHKPIVIFPGGLQWHQGLDIAIRAFPKVRARFPDAEFHIYGDGNRKESLVALSGELGLNGAVRFFDPLPVRQIAEIMANADLGVVPKRADSFGNEAYSTKIMEFMSLGVPVVVSSTKIDRYYFDDTVVRFFESGNVDALAEAMVEVLANPDRRSQMVSRASAYAARNAWQTRKTDYLDLVDSLVGVH